MLKVIQKEELLFIAPDKIKKERKKDYNIIKTKQIRTKEKI